MAYALGYVSMLAVIVTGVAVILRRVVRVVRWTARATADGMRDAHAEVYRPMLDRS